MAYHMNPMKTVLISVLTATLLGFASLASGRPFDAAVLIPVLFCSGLVALTVMEYSRDLRPLARVRPIRLTSPLADGSTPSVVRRLAA
jgi:hypothetical protein